MDWTVKIMRSRNKTKKAFRSPPYGADAESFASVAFVTMPFGCGVSD